MRRSMAQVLQAMAREMAALAQEAERLQALTGALVGGGADAALIEDAQALDALTQRLSALAGLLARIGQDAPAGWRLDIAPALAGVTLSDLAARIGHPVAAPSQAVAPTGDCELF
jgi:methionine synthase I (cobalamin-dependent)